MTSVPPPLAKVAADLRSGSLSARKLVSVMAGNHAATEDRLRAYKTWNGENALAQAKLVDGLIAQGMDLGPLMGIPVSVKDLYGVPGMPVFAGTEAELPEKWRRAGPVVRKVQQQLGIITGKTHTVEFAFGGLGVNAHWGTPVNPWSADKHRIPGGSSSGAGVSLVQGSALVALGTDTAGSVRIPASVTGQVGLKLTHGRWSPDGIVPLSPSFDTPGLLCRSVQDVAYAFAALDANASRPVRARPVAGLRLVTLSGPLDTGTDASIAGVVEGTLSALADAGALIGRTEIPGCAEVLELFGKGGLAAVELAAFLEDEFPDRIASLDPVVRARVEGAEGVSGKEYLRRKAKFAQHGQAALGVFDEFDLLVGPTVAISPPRLDALGTPDAYSKANMMALRNTAVVNLLGWCALTLPVGLDANGMPVGLQLVAPPMAERKLLSAALGIEALLGTGADLLGRPSALM